MKREISLLATAGLGTSVSGNGSERDRHTGPAIALPIRNTERKSQATVLARVRSRRKNRCLKLSEAFPRHLTGFVIAIFRLPR
jgi:hypothetical protein